MIPDAGPPPPIEPPEVTVLALADGTPVWLVERHDLPLVRVELSLRRAGDVVILLGTLTTLSYFFFSREHRGALGFSARAGIWFLMISFGAAFGFTVMGRVALLIGRLNFLILGWIYPTLGIS